MAWAQGAITDQYAYNEAIDRMRNDRYRHWVGDIGIECNLTVESDAGKVALETVEGGARFVFSVDVATGQGTLSCTRDTVHFIDPNGSEFKGEPTCQTPIRGSGSYQIQLQNADDRIFVWINRRPVKFQGVPYVDFHRDDPVRLKYSLSDPGDLEPVGVGAQGAKLSVSRIKVWRDVYYVSVSLQNGIEYRDVPAGASNMILDDPKLWETDMATKVFDKQERTEADVRAFGPDEFFPMGDNSPSSLNARLWPDPAYVDRQQLLGRACLSSFPTLGIGRSVPA